MMSRSFDDVRQLADNGRSGKRDAVDASLLSLLGIITCYGHRKCNLAMLTAYFDESGIHKGNHLCVVAGWVGVGNDAQWPAFAADWIPSIRPRTNLHMKKLRWGPKNRDRVGKLLARLGPIPHKYNLRPVFCGIWQRDYDAVIAGKVRQTFTTPFMLAAQQCMKDALKETPKNEKIAFIFARQDRYQDALRRLEDVVFKRANLDPRVDSISTREYRSTVCFDPADFFSLSGKGVCRRSRLHAVASRNADIWKRGREQTD